MKIALAHDYLNQWGGAERVLEVLTQMFPDAPIYTLLYDSEKLGKRFAGHTIKTSWLDSKAAQQNHHWFIPFAPFAMEQMVVDDCDLVISDSAGYGKGITVASGVKHIAYCHAPLRYAWESGLVAARLASAGIPGPVATFAETSAYPIRMYLRNWDWRMAQKPDALLANSTFIAKKLQTYYGRSAEVVHPPVDSIIFSYNANTARENYFLAVGRLTHRKKFDLMISACEKLHMPLKIVGADGNESKKIRALAGKNVEFCGPVSDSALAELYQRAQAVLFPQVEDFGLVAAEAIACGTPVIAYAAGGALEIVEDGVSGVLFYEQTAEGLAEAMQEAATISWDYAAIAKSAERFSIENFQRRILEAIGGLA